MLYRLLNHNVTFNPKNGSYNCTICNQTIVDFREAYHLSHIVDNEWIQDAIGHYHDRQCNGLEKEQHNIGEY